MKKKLTITYSLDEIIKDVANVNFLSGEAVASADNLRLKTLLQDVTEDGYRERMVRAIMLSMGEVKDKLYDYMPQEINEKKDDLWSDKDYGVTGTMSNKYYEPTEATLELMLPNGCPYSQGDYLRNLVQNFIVNRTVAEYAAFSPQLAQVWEQKAEADLVKIDVAVNRRKIVKRAMSTF